MRDRCQFLSTLALAACTAGGEQPPDAGPAIEPQSEAAALCPDFRVLKNPYFGDLHAHTSYSYDAYSFDTRNEPFDAYAFAKGMPVQIAAAQPGGGGPTTKLDRPLDFLALTDHGELLAIDYGCADRLDGTPYDPDSPFYASQACVATRSTNPQVQSLNFLLMLTRQNTLCNGTPADSPICRPVIQDAWAVEKQAAASALDRCKFTSFIGYEWTNNCTGDGGQSATCHKNVIFGDTNVPAIPLDSIKYPTQESLWAALDTSCNGGPCNAVTIPHNSNLSKGQAFTIPQGSEAHAQKYQKLVEIFQHKGGSECFYDAANPTDATCNFEYLGGVTEPNLAASYVRTGLEQGLTAQAATHRDALQLGIIGATDDHNGAPGNTREGTWPGHTGRLDDTPAARIDPGNKNAAGFNPGGVAVAWAEQNTRDSIFAAFQRRETYATSGPRMTVRMYQTWDQTTDFCADANFPAQIVAAGGGPMGSSITLPPSYSAGAPRIVVYAGRDPLVREDTANLAEIDLIEAWIDPATSAVKEQVVRRLAPAGGSGTMCQVFRPNAVGQPASFHAGSPSLYYARVLQVPTNRWSVYDCLRSPGTNPTDCAAGGKLNKKINERAWTSPIWYLP